ncbi:YbaK/EbsC family protein [Streptomyces sp. MP131-18]|uniref:YbaK/EbsC family protein n=1 Tax=Streptomyces sp. MP131-18 TaxID=1857892 RepID=UPI00097BAFC8|nr:YbaK/EbsC family protein [Streptomyces sp. MP131-18]ONK15926.1 YbaK/EbsC protein [Streptomyces sp. MP131-18]
MQAPFGDFDDVRPAAEAVDLMCGPVAAAVSAWRGSVSVDQFVHVDTAAEKADTADFIAAYGADLAAVSANCVVVAGRRAGETRLAACVVPAGLRLDVNGAVRRHLGVRKASFAPRETVVDETGMEYGGITPLGLPAGWPVLLDPAVVGLPHVLLGSGTRRGKLILPGKALLDLPGAEVVPGLGR